jgi:nitrogen-specific signal transduction histidine kinase
MYTDGSAGSELEASRQKCQLLQDQLQQLQKMEAVGHLTGGIAHDFANVLTVILGSGEMLVETLPPGDSRREYASDILEAADRARALTAQLLAFSRRRAAEPIVLDLNDVVTGMRNLLERTSGEDIDLRLRLAPNLDPVRADRVQIEQVLMNLVGNARDAMPHGGNLTIETRPVKLTTTLSQHGSSVGPGQYTMLAVTDTGDGMSPETRQRLFEPLFTTKASGHGTGFGLFTCDGIVTGCGGLILVDTEPGGGSVFTVLLPAVSGAVSAPARDVATKAGLQGHERVLVIEDNAETRTILRRVLEGFGYHVQEAGTGAAALALIGGKAPAVDIIISDVIIPGLNGPEVVRQAQSRFPTIKALFMSGHTTHALLRDGRLQGGLNFIQKPFGSLALASKLREVLDA